MAVKVYKPTSLDSHLHLTPHTCPPGRACGGRRQGMQVSPAAQSDTVLVMQHKARHLAKRYPKIRERGCFLRVKLAKNTLNIHFTDRY